MIVSIDDLRESYEGDLEEHDERYLEKLIGAAERRLKRLCPNARRLIDSGDFEDVEAVRDAIIIAVLRVVRDESPGYKAENEGNYGYQKNALVASGNIWYSDDDLATLGCGSSRGRIGSAKLSPDPTFAGTRRMVTRAGGWW